MLKNFNYFFSWTFVLKNTQCLELTWKCTHIYKKIMTSIFITVNSVTFCNATWSWCTWPLHTKGGYSSSVLHSGQTPPLRSHLVIHWRQKWRCYVSLRQWWEFISHTCEQTANWANTLGLKPLPYALGVKRMLALQRGLVIGHGLHTNNTFILWTVLWFWPACCRILHTTPCITKFVHTHRTLLACFFF